MKLKIVLHRQRSDEPDAGRIHAFVLQEFTAASGEKRQIRGSDLLLHRYTDMDSAYEAVDERIRREFKLIDVDVDYVIEDWQAKQV